MTHYVIAAIASTEIGSDVRSEEFHNGGNKISELSLSWASCVSLPGFCEGCA